MTPGVEPSEAPSTETNPWPRVVLWMVLAFLLVAGGLYVFKSLRDLPGEALQKTGNALQRAGKALADVASAFSQKNVTTTFISYASSVHASQHLQFATLRQTEVFTQTDEATTAFGYIPLPEVIVEARAPVEYNYFVDLNAKWELHLKDNTVYVLAPRIQFSKPAVDASEISYEIRKGSVFRKSGQAQENLKKSITFLAQQRARENIGLVRDTARKQIAEFVEKWLAKSFTDGKNYPVKVFFPGEQAPPGLQPIDSPLQ